MNYPLFLPLVYFLPQAGHPPNWHRSAAATEKLNVVAFSLDVFETHFIYFFARLRSGDRMKKIGVFICHCGINIANTVDVEKVTREIAEYPGVAHAENYTYMCSDPGQALIAKAIKEKELDAVVVAACSPTLHELTFRKVSRATGLNPYQCEIANIREQCSWVHPEKHVATSKALRIIKTVVEKARYNESLDPISVSLTKKALVIGGGIAGIQASLDIANSGYEVVLVERTPSIGGHMAQLSETFPTLDCSQCILTPRMVEVAQHPKITLHTYSEIEDISGYAGNFKIKIKKKPRYVDEDKCTSCGDCMIACPVRNEPHVQPQPKYSSQIEKKELGKLDAIISKYSASPPRKEMLIQILQDVNSEYNYLPEHTLKYVSEKLEIPLTQVYHVATFYTAFSLKPRGRHLIKVCMGTACHTRGALRVLEELERRLEIKAGETTRDLEFTLETVNCLGCCALGPVVVVGNDYHAAMLPGQVDSLLEAYRSKEN